MKSRIFIQLPLFLWQQVFLFAIVGTKLKLSIYDRGYTNLTGIE